MSNFIAGILAVAACIDLLYLIVKILAESPVGIIEWLFAPPCGGLLKGSLIRMGEIWAIVFFLF